MNHLILLNRQVKFLWNLEKLLNVRRPKLYNKQDSKICNPSALKVAELLTVIDFNCFFVKTTTTTTSFYDFCHVKVEDKGVKVNPRIYLKDRKSRLKMRNQGKPGRERKKEELFLMMKKQMIQKKPQVCDLQFQCLFF